jgi:hypothetical protein
VITNCGISHAFSLILTVSAQGVIPRASNF